MVGFGEPSFWHFWVWRYWFLLEYRRFGGRLQMLMVNRWLVMMSSFLDFTFVESCLDKVLAGKNVRNILLKS